MKKYLSILSSKLVKTKLLHFVIAITLLTINAKSQQTFTFSALTYEDGLCNDYVTSFVQDKYGFMWIGTANGLNKFDGYTVSSFLVGEIVRDLALDRQGNIIIASENLYKLDISTHKISTLASSSKFKSLKNNYFQSILIDGNKIWCVFESKNSFGCFNFSNNNLQQYSVQKLANISSNIVNIAQLKNQDIALSTPQGLVIFNKQSEKCQLIQYDYKKLGQISSGISKIITDKKGKLWMQTGSILLWYDETSKKIVPFNDRNFKDGKCEFINISSNFFINQNQELWTSSDKGLLIYNLNNGQYSLQFNNYLNPAGLSSLYINVFYEDNSNNIWLGSIDRGAFTANIHSKKFTSLSLGPDGKDIISTDYIWDLFVNKKDEIWVASEKGLNRWNPLTNEIIPYKSNPNDKESQTKGQVLSVFEDNMGVLWVGTYRLDRMKNTSSNIYPNKFDKFYNIPTDTASLSGWTIWNTFQDSKSNLWFGTSSNICMLPNDELYKAKPKFLGLNQKLKNVIENMAVTFFEDSAKNIWIGSNNLFFLDMKSKTFREYSIKSVYSIHQDKKNRLWFGTGTNGLLQYMGNDLPPEKQFRQFSTKEGLADRRVWSIEEDNKGNFWLSTNKGISKFDTEKLTFQNFDQADGLPTNQFTRASCKTSDGKIYFGSTKGIVCFYPDSMKISIDRPKVIITTLYVKGKLIEAGDTLNGDVILKENIFITREIILKHKNNDFAIEFSVLNYNNPQKIKYAYMLEGYQTSWQFITGKDRKVAFTFLPAGTYKLKLKASNEDGIWNPEPTSLIIQVLPPWYNTLVFKFVTIAIFFFLLFVYVSKRTKHLIKSKLKLENIVAERTEQLKITNIELVKQQLEVTAQKKEIERKYTDILTLSEIGQKITASLKAEEIISRVYASVNVLMDAPSFSIGLLNNAKTQLDFWGYHQKDSPISQSLIKLTDEERLSVWCLRNKEIVFMNDVENEVSNYFNKTVNGYTKQNSPKSSIYLPLLSNDTMAIGILIVKSYKSNMYSKLHLEILKTLASYISIAVDNAHVYNELEIQAGKIKELDLIRTRFFVNVSHEFRTPLTLILAPLEKLLKTGDNISWEDSKKELILMQRNAKRLLQLINQLLEIRKIETGSLKLNLELININGFVMQVIQQFSCLVETRQITLTINSVNPSLILSIDTDKMEKVLTNLLSNAFKYTNIGGAIKVSLIEKGSQTVQIIVSDNGNGIPAQHLSHIFDRFYQAENQSTWLQEGTGIGLSLTKDLVELHNGTIECSSAINDGTIFTITLNSLLSQNQASVETSAITENNSYKPQILFVDNNTIESAAELHSIANQPQVLIVEDNEDIRQLIANELNKKYHIFEASNGKEGIEIANNFIPDLIISDVMMPVMDGLQFCKEIKNDIRTSHIPVIMLTARNSEESELEGLATGADDYITKPFSIDAILLKINNIVATRNKIIQKFKTDVSSESSALATNPYDLQFMEKVQKYIFETMADQEFNPDIFAREMAMSPSQLYRKIKGLTGLSVNIFVRTIKLKQALKLLQTGQYTVSEVSYMTGFASLNYFSQRFKEQFNNSPTSYIPKH